MTSADIPDTKHCLPAMERMERMASIVTSSEVAESKNTAIMVEWSVLNSFQTFSGSSSMGTEMSARSSYQRTVSTWLTFSIFSLSATTSFAGISSRMMKEKAPLPKSSFRRSCPTTVSMSDGR